MEVGEPTKLGKTKDHSAEETSSGASTMDLPTLTTPSLSPPEPNITTLNDGAKSDGSPALQPPFNQTDLFKALEVVERDSLAIAESFTSLFDSLRLALSESTSSSLDHMHCFCDAAGRIQESAIEAAARGNRFIISCHRLNEEMKGVDALAVQLHLQRKVLKRHVNALDMAVDRLVRIS